MSHGYDHSRILDAIEKMVVSSAHAGLFPEIVPYVAKVVELLKIPIPHMIIGHYVERCVEARKTGVQSSFRNDFLSKATTNAQCRKDL